MWAHSNKLVLIFGVMATAITKILYILLKFLHALKDKYVRKNAIKNANSLSRAYHIQFCVFEFFFIWNAINFRLCVSFGCGAPDVQFVIKWFFDRKECKDIGICDVFGQTKNSVQLKNLQTTEKCDKFWKMQKICEIILKLNLKYLG